jgi:cell division protein FtsN
VPQRRLAKLWPRRRPQVRQQAHRARGVRRRRPTGRPAGPAKAEATPAKAEPAKPEPPPKQPPPKQQEASKPAQPASTEAAPAAAKPAQPASSEAAPTKPTTNAAPATTAPAQSAATAQSAAPTQSATPPKPAADPAGHFVLQLASLPSQAEAERASAALKSGHADLLGKLDFTIHRADLGAAKGVWYRVFAGPLAAHDDAVRLCERLRAAAHPADCFVMALK